MADLLEQKDYEVRRLLDRDATRKDFLGALEDFVVGPAKPDDDLVLYFAGHGSKTPDTNDDEVEGWDETLVFADAADGTPDLRDEEFRRLLAPALARGARLTVILDACYGGSALRGAIPPRGTARSAPPAAVRTGRRTEPDAESIHDQVLFDDGRGLLLAAAQGFQPARESAVPGDGVRGVFTRALLRSLGTASPAEPAWETFRRAAARMSGEGWHQRPVFSGSEPRRQEPLFPASDTSDRRDHDQERALVIHVPEVADAADLRGLVVHLEGGWTSGLRPGDVLSRSEPERPSTLLRLTDVDAVRSRAEVVEPGSERLEIGDVLTRIRQAEPAEPDLTVWVPESSQTVQELVRFAKLVVRAAEESGAQLSRDPTDDQVTRVLRFEEMQGWVVLGRDGQPIARLGRAPSDDEAIRRIQEYVTAGDRLFVQLPLPHDTARRLFADDDPDRSTTKRVPTPDAALYQLVGSLDQDSVRYTWVHSAAAGAHQLPSQTPAIRHSDTAKTTAALRAQMLRLADTRFWFTIEAPPDRDFPYRLALRTNDGTLLKEATSTGSGPVATNSLPLVYLGREYGFTLFSPGEPGAVEPRYVYVVLIDAMGRRQLMFPRGLGGTDHYVPPDTRPPGFDLRRIRLGTGANLRVTPPLGIDHYILLSTNEPLPDPMVLDDSAPVDVRSSNDHPLARILIGRRQGVRTSAPLPTRWSIDRLAVRAVEH